MKNNGMSPRNQLGISGRTRSVIPIAVTLVVLFILPFLISQFWMFLLCEVFVLALAATALNLLAAYTGLVSFGHAAYYGIGAYACALFLTRSGLSPWLGILISPFVALLAAAMIGLIDIDTPLYNN